MCEIRETYRSNQWRSRDKGQDTMRYLNFWFGEMSILYAKHRMECHRVIGQLLDFQEIEEL